MQPPIALPSHLYTLSEKAPGPDALLRELMHLGDKDIVDFFIAGADDQSWAETANGQVVLKSLFKSLTDFFYKGTLSEGFAKKIAECVREDGSYLEDLIPTDFYFQVKGESIPCNSLLFSTISNHFKELILDWREKNGDTDLHIPLPKTNLHIFHLLRNFVHTGQIPSLWKQEPQDIFKLIEAADRFEIESMNAFAFRTFKNYLSKENVTDLLAGSLKSSLPLFVKEAAEYLDNLNPGFSCVETYPGALELTVGHVAEEWQDRLPLLLPYSVSLKIETLKNCTSSFYSALSSSKISGLCLGGKEDPILSDYLPLFDALSSRSITHLKWEDWDVITEEWMQKTLSSFPKIKNLSFSWIRIPLQALSTLKEAKDLRSITFQHCPELGTSSLDMAIEATPSLQEVILEDCSLVSPQSIDRWKISRPNIDFKLS